MNTKTWSLADAFVFDKKNMGLISNALFLNHFISADKSLNKTTSPMREDLLLLAEALKVPKNSIFDTIYPNLVSGPDYFREINEGTFSDSDIDKKVKLATNTPDTGYLLSSIPNRSRTEAIRRWSRSESSNGDVRLSFKEALQNNVSTNRGYLRLEYLLTQLGYSREQLDEVLSGPVNNRDFDKLWHDLNKFGWGTRVTPVTEKIREALRVLGFHNKDQYSRVVDLASGPGRGVGWVIGSATDQISRILAKK